MYRPGDLPVQAYFADPTAVDLGHEEASVSKGEGTVGTAEGSWRVVPAPADLPQLSADAMLPLGDHDDAAVLDVGGDDVAVGQHHRVVGVVQLVRAEAGHAWGAVLADLVGGDVDDADDVVVLFGRDDLGAVGSEERVVGDLEGLSSGQVTRLRELPSGPSLRVDDQQPIVEFVRSGLSI